MNTLNLAREWFGLHTDDQPTLRLIAARPAEDLLNLCAVPAKDALDYGRLWRLFLPVPGHIRDVQDDENVELSTTWSRSDWCLALRHFDLGEMYLPV